LFQQKAKLNIAISVRTIPFKQSIQTAASESEIVTMIYQSLVVVALCVVGASANVWTSSFVAPARIASRKNQLSMVAVMDGKTAQLNRVKARYSGRGDMVSMIEEDSNDVETYNFFAEADEEETNPPKTGQTITGTIIEMDDNGALLEIGGKMSGYLPLKEASLIPVKHVNTLLEIGQEVTAEVIGTLKGMPVISLRAAQLVTAWEQALSMRATDATFEVKVLEVNRGGVVVAALGLKAFLPGSHYMGTPDESIIGNVVKVNGVQRSNASKFRLIFFLIFFLVSLFVKFRSCALLCNV
jgi:predicted RNA-binding protein with RPS1 domain